MNKKSKQILIIKILLVAAILFVGVKFISSEIENRNRESGPITPSTEKQILTAEEIEKLQNREQVKVAYAIDGDTIRLESEEKLRYIGIDTPEKDRCFFKEASEANAKLVQGKKIKIVKDVSEVDEYGRLLRYVWVDDLFVNDYLVRNGFARAKNFPPDEKLKEKFKEAELEARENRRGMWGDGVCE